KDVAQIRHAKTSLCYEFDVNRLREHSALVVFPRERQWGFAIRSQGELDKRVPADAGAPDEVRRLTVTVRHADIIDEIGGDRVASGVAERSEEHTSELQSRFDLVCRLLLEK